MQLAKAKGLKKHIRNLVTFALNSVARIKSWIE